MSNIARRLKRQALRDQYDRFGAAWRHEKRYQSYAVENKMAFVKETEQKLPDGTRQRLFVQDDQPDMVLLGRKPTFHNWMKAMENQSDKVVVSEPDALPQEETKLEVADTEW
jgi:hypothetical protein